MNDKSYEDHRQDPLWGRIRAYTPDDPDAGHPFTAKLAVQQHWSPTFARRVVEEYKRFIYLCCISPHGASPPPAVDEAWHLHLTYTTSYWQDFCRDTLGQSIHHHPSAGGTWENEKHRQWYNATLDLYKEKFGQSPPPDIWPPPHLEGGRYNSTIPPQLLKVTRSRYILLLFLPFAISTFCFFQPIPFLLTGFQFLVFYTVLIAGAVAFMLMLSRAARSQLRQVLDFDGTRRSRYELAYLGGGENRMLQMCLYDLLYHEHILYNGKSGYRLNVAEDTISDNPLFPYLQYFKDVDGFTLDDLAQYLPELSGYLHKAYNDLQVGYNRLTGSALLPVLTLSVGVARCIQGVINDKPIAILVIIILFGMLLLLPLMLTITFHYAANRELRDDAATDHIDSASARKVILYGMAGVATLVSFYSLSNAYRTDAVYKARNGGGDGGGCSSGGGSGCGSSCGSGCGGCGGGD